MCIRDSFGTTRSANLLISYHFNLQVYPKTEDSRVDNVLEFCWIDPPKTTQRLPADLGCQSVQHDDARQGGVRCREQLVEQRLVPVDTDQTVLGLRDQVVIRSFGWDPVDALQLDW